MLYLTPANSDSRIVSHDMAHFRVEPKVYEIAKGVTPIREESNSSPNLDRNCPPCFTSTVRQVMCPRISISDASHPISAIGPAGNEHDCNTVRTAPAAGEPSGLHRTVEKDYWIVCPAVGTQVGTPATLQDRRGALFHGTER